MSPKNMLMGLLLACAVAWGVLTALSFTAKAFPFAMAQRELLYDRGRSALNDYYMPWKCAHEGYAQESERIDYESPDGRKLTMDRLDRCYPALALLPYRLLPYSNAAAAGFSLACGLVFLLALAFVARASGLPAVTGPLLFATGFFLFTLERANPVPLAAASVAVFLVWHDSPSRPRRFAAAVALAFATALKLSPAVLGVLYLRRRDFRSVFVSASLTLAFILLPFGLLGGWTGLASWADAAMTHGREMVGFSAFGFAPFARAIRIFRGEDWQTGISLWCQATRLVGLAALAVAAFLPRRNDAVLWAVVGLLLAPGNMLFYAGLYLVPVALVRSAGWRRGSSRDWTEAAVWFALFFALQLPFRGFAVNRLVAAAAVFALPLFALRPREDAS